MGDWSPVAEEWARWWGSFAAPARELIARAAAVGSGTRTLDVGCGSGEFLAELAARGARVAGVDPAAKMLDLARQAAPAADVRVGTPSAFRGRTANSTSSPRSTPCSSPTTRTPPSPKWCV